MKKQEKKKTIFFNVVKEHVENNLKQYLIIGVLFIIGIIIGVIVVNNMQLQTKEHIGTEIKTFIDCLKNQTYQIDYISLLKSVITNHILFTLLLWFLGCSVIGIPIVYILITYRGFSLGYTISSIILSLGIGKGALFSIITLLLQNILIVPAIIGIAVSGTRLYSSIVVKNKRMENIKIEIIKHTIFCILMLVLLVIASIIEVYISDFLINLCAKYF